MGRFGFEVLANSETLQPRSDELIELERESGASDGVYGVLLHCRTPKRVRHRMPLPLEPDFAMRFLTTSLDTDHTTMWKDYSQTGTDKNRKSFPVSRVVVGDRGFRLSAQFSAWPGNVWLNLMIGCLEEREDIRQSSQYARVRYNLTMACAQAVDQIVGIGQSEVMLQLRHNFERPPQPGDTEWTSRPIGLDGLAAYLQSTRP